MSTLIDTHCHLTDMDNSQIEAVIARAKSAGVNKLICIGASKGTESSFRAVEIANQYPEVYCSVGIHPHDADQHHWSPDLISIAKNKKVVAIGETGLDFFKNWSDFDAQRTLFIKSINIAKDLKKPLVIHCRDAFEECVQVLENEGAAEIGGVFHCFSGTAYQAEILSRLNFLVSYTGLLTFKNSTEIKENAALIPLSCIMLETDCPYMAPEPYRGKTSEPAHVAIIAETLSKVHKTSIDEVKIQTTNNALRLFPLLSH
ncbi:MAG TPA: TatD family hydrolase [Oligoflexia bacterium]|nr:TatD family hydrolase [Oligoflexia bacterium]